MPTLGTGILPSGAVGNELVAVTRRLQGHVRQSDLVAQQKAAEGVPIRWSPLPGIPGRVG